MRLVAACVAVLVVLGARDALACGGCFGGVDVPTVVTDHRMVLTISQQQTTLYDQIHYQGAPESFAWVLPIRGDAEVGLSSDIVFAELDAMTQTIVRSPPKNCWQPNNCLQPLTKENFVANVGTTVTHHEVVGPYETVQLHASDPGALASWLTSHGYSLPPEMEATLAEYVADGLDFLALKLVPGQSIETMRPVRVTTQGASPVLPLRMVAAGTGATVGITLWVIGEGRYEPQNFPWFRIADDEIEWRWSTNRSNYAELRQAMEKNLGGRGWELESSLDIPTKGFTANIRSDTRPNYEATQTMSATEVRDADLTALFSGIGVMARVTRLRADLAHVALDRDLSLTASADQSSISGIHTAREVDQPQCPVYKGCVQTDETAPRDLARQLSLGISQTRGCGCGVSPGARTEAVAALLVLVVLRRSRRRR